MINELMWYAIITIEDKIFVEKERSNEAAMQFRNRVAQKFSGAKITFILGIIGDPKDEMDLMENIDHFVPTCYKADMQ